MRVLYDLFFLAFSLFYIPVLLLKGKLHADFPQRFGFLRGMRSAGRRPVWIHAVSVGEVVLAARLSRAVKRRFPEAPVVVSTTTRTGNDMMRRQRARPGNEGIVDDVFYFPLDFSFVVSRVVRELRPRLYVMIETELWPNLLEELRLRGVPVVLANGRISDRSYSSYRRIGAVTRRILRCVDRFCMQSDRDAERIKSLGARPDKVFTTGSMKFDEELPGPGKKPFSKEQLGFEPLDKVLVAGSTHFPEEKELIDVYGDLLNDHGDLRLILAPRHVERSDAVRIYLEKSGLDFLRFSDVIDGKKGGAKVLLVDTIGHLKDLYSLASCVFVGGSLAKKGGQNPIEAARWGKPVIFGPDMSNFREVSGVFLEKGAALQVSDAAGLKAALDGLLRDPGRLKKMGGAALKAIEENSGALERTVARISGYLE